MKKELVVQINTISGIGSVDEAVKRIRDCFDSAYVKDVYDKVKLAKEWAKIKKEIDKTRDSLFIIEVECIIKMHELGESIKGISVNVASFYVKNKNNIKSLMSKYEHDRTPISMYRTWKREMEGIKARKYGNSIANGKADYEESDTEKVNEAAALEYRKLASAMSTVMENLASTEKPFTIREMADKYISDYVDTEDKSLNHDIVEGIREVCRETVYSARVTVLGDMKTPKFVTFYLEEQEKYMRIPFANAKMWQLDQMIGLRKKQLEEDTKAYNNLLKVKEEIEKISKDKDKTFKQIITDYESS